MLPGARARAAPLSRCGRGAASGRPSAARKYPARGRRDSSSRPNELRGHRREPSDPRPPPRPRRGNPPDESHREARAAAAAVLGDAVLDTLVPSFPAGAVDELRSQVHGPVYAAGDDGMAAEVATWNVAVQHTPAIAVGATCAADVAAAVSWAVAHDLRVAVQATGHGPVRNAAGSLMITTRRMQGAGHRPRAAHRPRRGRREVEPGPRGRRRVRPRRAVRVVVRRRRRRLHARRRHGLARPQARLRGRPRPGRRDRHRRRPAAPGLRRLRARAVLGRPRRQGQLRHRHRAGDRAGAGRLALRRRHLLRRRRRPRASCTAFRQWAPTLPEEVSTSIAILRMPAMEELPPPLRGQTVVHLRYAYSGDRPRRGRAAARRR